MVPASSSTPTKVSMPQISSDGGPADLVDGALLGRRGDQGQDDGDGDGDEADVHLEAEGNDGEGDQAGDGDQLRDPLGAVPWWRRRRRPAGSRGPYMPEPKPLKGDAGRALAPTLTDIRASAACSTKWPHREDSRALPPRTMNSTRAMTRLKMRLLRKSRHGAEVQVRLGDDAVDGDAVDGDRARTRRPGRRGSPSCPSAAG